MPENSLPEFVNKRRRRNLFLYTIIALLAYQPSFGVIYLSKILINSENSNAPIELCYLGFTICSISALILIHFKKQITKKYIFFILHYQSVFTIIISAYMLYAMGTQRYLGLIAYQVVLVFVFIQSTLFVSLLTIFLTVIVYLSASYIGIIFSGQSGSLIGELLYVLIYAPVCVFIAYMSKKMQDQQKEIKKANSKLKITHTELESQNKKVIESIRYAELIQRSLLPGIERIKTLSPDSMFIWMPKDFVGGDIFYTYTDHSSGSIIALMDCTGHGVPGAFLTMIVYSEIRKIIMEDDCYKPSEILSRLNRAVKNVLHNNNDTNANDGLDAAICLIDHTHKKVIYAGAKIPLFYVKNRNLYKTNGDKKSIGYKDSDDHFEFTNYSIDVDSPCQFYLKTDGYTDQLGGKRHRRFGTKRFIELVNQHHDEPFCEQREMFLNALKEHQGDNEQIDDITLIGFHL